MNLKIGSKQKKVVKNMKVKTPALARKVAMLVNQAYDEYKYTF